MKAIVAVDMNWGIGYKGSLLQRIPEDMKNFTRLTTGKVVVMGRETYESLPGKAPLKNRTNIILTRNNDLFVDGFIVCHSFEELFTEFKKYNPDDIFVIGGEAVYKLLLPFCDEAYVTKIANEYVADKYFVNLDESDDWKLDSVSEDKHFNDITFQITKYVKAD